ncbi:TetR/AcrR family transcriptional regulator [Nonomuraea roseoviolacea]|uniref:TetR/AcrR family transcriptional repressor of nem operon n=1 Tax=Nonomuraea roseoviolacea subsp. carminata TaxID=160689 RepID=A0ABT1K199_9ACTN|nr:TetR/AcrR family transcriptional regulator [Nonomuraea roseoviolacea]MCP2347774.1 TetR/AcrR family transcriptional repressor of nem operon [Nonomuraea roseoviolacea subsp. carminata]
MARSKEFDPGAALDAALELFWERGYESTSMADLVERLGIGRASLYATFGGKHELYMKALERFTEVQNPSAVELLSQPGPALPAVRRLVGSFARQSSSEEGKRGCMIVNAAAELLPRDEEVCRFVDRNWDKLETALTSALIRARAQGELDAGKDPRALARFLIVVLQGMRVMGKASPDPARMRDAAAHALSLL